MFFFSRPVDYGDNGELNCRDKPIEEFFSLVYHDHGTHNQIHTVQNKFVQYTQYNTFVCLHKNNNYFFLCVTKYLKISIDIHFKNVYKK